MRSISRQVQEWYNAWFYKCMRSKPWQFKETINGKGTWQPSQEKGYCTWCCLRHFVLRMPELVQARKQDRDLPLGLESEKLNSASWLLSLAAREFLLLGDSVFICKWRQGRGHVVRSWWGLHVANTCEALGTSNQLWRKIVTRCEVAGRGDRVCMRVRSMGRVQGPGGAVDLNPFPGCEGSSVLIQLRGNKWTHVHIVWSQKLLTANWNRTERSTWEGLQKIDGRRDG